jgi:hypothetical protein
MAQSPFTEDITVSNTFDSHLEIPTSGDPSANATLTLTLRYKLEFADGKNRVTGVIVERESQPKALDGTKFAHDITDWDDQSRAAFTKRMWLSQKIWTYKFLLIPPPNYSGLDFKHPQPGLCVRPNVMCALQMQSFGAPHIRITVVRVAEGPMPFTESTNDAPPRNILITESAPQTPVLGHELGHALGMKHIKVLLGDKACMAHDNAERCYGETPQELANIMGQGRDLWPINAQPWIERIMLHTNTRPDLWKPSMDLRTPPQILKTRP